MVPAGLVEIALGIYGIIAAVILALYFVQEPIFKFLCLVGLIIGVSFVYDGYRKAYKERAATAAANASADRSPRE